ncbi:hypothetical protein [Micromonospora sp. NBC_01796]|uniref:hypothetical protein n=1 Tax=Micromonospora sp. NBC_01796 TaxID=2975987 RepID=UPI002DD8E85C|nr:hypothetical protein [Micromonospora sp. NBC_01796]WSA83087.1 hypothetical protein OIE47_22010 [Micromonospora sp. NBC_01796]
MKKRLLGVAAAAIMLVAASLSIAAPAQAAESPVALCGSDYYVLDSHGVSGATVYVLASRGGAAYNCVVTIKTANRGKATWVAASIGTPDGRSGIDEGNFLYYAGPIRISAPSQCIQWGGAGGNRSWWTSAWSYCS